MSSFAKLLNSALLIIALAFIAWVALFKVHAPDFWWHVKAGQIMRDTGWITTDPFAYTREGALYLASQSWLSEIIMSIVYDYFNIIGVIFFRILLTLSALGTLLLIDKKRIFPNAFLAMAAAIALRSTLLDRPQMFSFVMLSITLLLTFKLLDLPSASSKARSTNLCKYLILMLLSFILWINFHGGAAFVTFAFLGAILLQDFWNRRKLIMFSIIPVFLIAALASPLTTDNYIYLKNLYTDKTAQFILEWRPLDALTYWKYTFVFWFLPVTSFALAMRKPIASWIILFSFAYLSISASRHIALFILISTGLTIYQLKHSDTWNDWMNKLLSNKKYALSVSLVLILTLFFINQPVQTWFDKYDFNSIGTFEPASEAYDFVEANEPTGNMFNSYNLGAYLLHRGYPDRKVFVDGRNVDYGYEFLDKTFKAANDEKIWKELEDKYNLTYALVDYKPKKNPDSPYAYMHLNNDQKWSLVYINDWIALYYKNIPEHRNILDKYAYTILDSDNFGRGTVLAEVEQSDVRLLADELMRQSASDPQGITSSLLLAEIFIASNILDNAKMVLEDAIQRQPKRYEPYELMATVYEKMNEKEMSDVMYRKAKKLAN
ncbi:MAG: hypothetical protein QF741_04425 [Candidatus Peribacteraceae bacterium]|jgi:hypothetical protein|nr:hypothetical protein [Candidatus Peribacteraceae bacterium]